MTKIKLKPLVLTMLVLIGSVFLLSGCFLNNPNTNQETQSNNGETQLKGDPFSFYNKIQMGQTKDAVKAALGDVTEASDGYFQYVDKDNGYGIVVSYNDANQVTYKMFYAADQKALGALGHSKVTENMATAITAGMTFDDVKAKLGEDGVEVMQEQNPADPSKPYYSWTWINPDGTNILVTFIGEKGTVESAEFYKE